MRRAKDLAEQVFLSELEKEYFEWLCDLAGFPRSGPIRYEKLARTLYSVMFEYFVPNDDNRAEDGKNLRRLFSQQKSYNNISKQLNSDCNVLEMIIGLALRMDYIIDHPGKESEVKKWFWEMLDNLGVSIFDDQSYYGLAHQQVTDILKKFLARRYYANGSNGGLFPLKSRKKDQRKIELWYQMQAYIEENY